jgi:signal transduction histidine kinase
MNNPAQDNLFALKGYFFLAILIIFLGTASATLLSFITIKENTKNNSRILKKEASNIEKAISESFNYSNKINSYIGKQIAEHDAKDLEFILKTFKQTDQIQNKNTQLLSWSSFDWVDKNCFQLVNSKVGIRKNPPNMSARQYCKESPQKPWTLQVSFPVLGNPSESWVVPAATGITDKNNKYLGAVVVGFSLSELSAMVEQRLNDPVSFVVLDEDMNLIIQSFDSELEESKNFYKKIDKSLFAKKSSFLKEKITDNNVSYLFYQKFDDYPYIVLIGFNKDFLKKEFNSSIIPIVIGFASITLFFLIILFYMFKTRILILLDREEKLKNSLLNANNAKTKLIRATSHDLKNYIFGISGLSKLILQDKKKSEIEKNEDLKMIEEISNQSEELMGFVEDLLDTNQSETGEFTLGKMQVCNVVELCKRMVILNKNFARENLITLEVKNLSQNQLNIECDARRIKQILNNLISNSIKYSVAKTKVVIETSYIKETGEICISISDSGIGMTEQEIKMALSGDGEKIDKSALDKQIDSHGIGMPIIKKLVELHNGRMEIFSKKDYGTEVKIYFKSYN